MHILRTSLTLTCLALPLASFADILPNPVITNSATPFNPSFSAGNVLDGSKQTDYASQGQGANTFIDFDFGAPVSIDAFAMITRNSPDDFISSFDLIFSNNADFSAASIVTVNGDVNGNVGGRLDGPLRLFAPQTARYVRWDVTGIGTSAFFNQGAAEMRFLNNTANLINGVTTFNSSPEFNANFPASGAVDGNVGTSDFRPGTEFATPAQGDTFIDFDLGEGAGPVTGFDFFQRHVTADRATGYDVIFSDDPTFTTNIATRSYTGTQAPWTFDDQFAPIDARFVRVDVTSIGGPGNFGMAEALFYTVPEPGAAISLLSGLGLLLARRRRT